jgi:hypothetical protein
MNKKYAIEKSPLYRLRNRRKLAECLNLPTNYFRQEHEYVYKEFSRPKPNGDGERHFTEPRNEIKVIQKRICKLMKRIETPAWLMSGKEGCSYITNSEEHLKYKFVKTMDISKFYDSAEKSRVYSMFRNTFKMEHDIAWIMTDLVTFNGGLPTGSPSSQLIVYWTYAEMFEKINLIAERNGCHFSLYVDDMTFSSNMPIPSDLREEVDCLLKKYGLKAKVQKDHYYQSNDFKVVTGVGIKKGKKIVPNGKRKKIIELYAQCKENTNIKDIEKLKGMLCAARQIEADIFPEIYNYILSYEKELQEFSKVRFYKTQRKRYVKRRQIKAQKI